MKDSQAIFNKIWELLESESLVSKLVGISTDGEPKIASKKNGVVGKFLNKLPHIIHIHCICHQLVLGAREVFKKKDKRYVHPIAEVLNRLNDLVYKVSSFFCASSKRNIVLMSAEEEALEEMNNYQLLRPFDVRWLSNFVAIERLLDLYPAVVKALKILEPSKKTLLTSVMITELTKSWNLMFLYTYADILSPLHSLSKQFQRKDITVEEVKTSFSCCVVALRNFTEKKLGLRTTQFLKSCQKNEQGQHSFKNVPLSSNTSFEEESIQLKENTKDVVEIIIKGIYKRFDQLNVLSNYSCLDFTKIKALRVNEVANFGEKSIKVLIEFYKSKGVFYFFQKKSNTKLIWSTRSR